MLGLHASWGLHRRLAGLSLICHEELVYALRLFLPCQKTGQQLGTISLTVSEARKQRLISHSLSVRGDRQAQDLQWGLSNPAEKSHRVKLTHHGKSQNKSSACFALIFKKRHFQNLNMLLMMSKGNSFHPTIPVDISKSISWFPYVTSSKYLCGRNSALFCRKWE